MYRTISSAETIKEILDRNQEQEWVYLEDRGKIVISIRYKLEYKTGSMVTYETSKIPSIYSRKDYILEMRNSLLRIMEEIRDNFEDFRDRQICFFKLKKALESARKESQVDPVLLELIICLFDTVKNLYSENLTIEHIAILETIIYYIDSRITEADVDEATEKLISAGLNPLPKLDGLAEIYKRQGEI